MSVVDKRLSARSTAFLLRRPDPPAGRRRLRATIPILTTSASVETRVFLTSDAFGCVLRVRFVFVLAVFDVAGLVAAVFSLVVLLLCFVLAGVEVLATFFETVFFGADLLARALGLLVVFRVVFLLA